MCHFKIKYDDGTTVEYAHVIKATYSSNTSTTTVEEQDLPKHCFSTINPLWLHSGSGTMSVARQGIRTIQVTKE